MKKVQSEKKKRNTPGGPSLREQRDMLCDRLSFTAAESYKQLRANLLFAMPDENKCRIVGVTSSIRGEGKSTTTINLAYTLAQTGKRTLLIDADMRLPSVARKLAAPSRPGLSNLLAGLSEAKEAIHASTFMDNWQIMPAGDIPPNPSELLGSEQMAHTLRELSRTYDFIVVDLPPVDIVSDALAISQWVNGIIVVVRSGYTDRRSLSECMRQLGVLKSKLLGFVMTDVEESNKEYGKYGKKYYGYSNSYSRSGTTRSDEAARKEPARGEGKQPARPAPGTQERRPEGAPIRKTADVRPAGPAQGAPGQGKDGERKAGPAPQTAGKKKGPSNEPTIKLPQDIFDMPRNGETEQ